MKHKKDRKRSDPTGQFRRKQLNILAMGIGVAGVTLAPSGNITFGVNPERILVKVASGDGWVLRPAERLA